MDSNHYFHYYKSIILFSDPPQIDDRHGSGSASVCLEYLKICFHKVEFSVRLKKRKCIKITANINNQQLKWNYSISSTSYRKFRQAENSRNTWVFRKELSTESDVLQREYTIINRMILTIGRKKQPRISIQNNYVSLKSLLRNMLSSQLQCLNLNFNKSLSQY